MPRSAVAAGLPTAVDLSAWTVPVGDQGSIGSCVSWAISYGMMGWYSRYQHLSDSGTAFAPMYSYSQINADDSVPDGGGTWPSSAYQVGIDQGVDTQADYWQGNYDFLTLPTAAETANAAHYRTGPFSYVYSGTPGTAADDSIRSVIASNHPVALTLPVDSAFDRLNPTDHFLDVGDVDTSTYRGSHEVLIVGYDDRGVRIQNSWGTGWGDGGFAELDWGFVEQYSTEATYMTGLVDSGGLGAPTAVAASPASTSSATLTWAAPTDTGGSAVTGYRVSRDAGTAGGTGWSGTVSATARSTTFTNLVPGATYTLSVAAVNGQGTGPAASVTVTVPATALPGAPTTVSAKPASATSATLTWAPPASTGGSAVTGYRVSRDAGTAGGTGWSGTVAATARSTTFTNLVPGATYTLSVAAVNGQGTGPATSVTVLVAAAPAAPRIGTATSGVSGGAVTATATWSPPASDGGAAVTGYRVRALRMSSTGTVLGTTTSALQPATSRSLAMVLPQAGSYRFTVQAVNAAGTSPQSARSNQVAGR